MSSASTSASGIGPRGQLARRILETFEAHRDHVLLRDHGRDLTGEACLERLRVLEDTLATVAPPGATVGVLIPPSALQAFAIAALWALEYVPRVLDPWPSRPLRGAGRDLHAVLTTAEAPALPRAPVVLRLASGTSAVHVSGAPTPTDTDTTTTDARASVHAPLLPSAAGLTLLTSGSSGRPKEVILPTEGLLYVADLLIHRFSLDEHTVAAVSLPLHHTMGLNTQFLPCLLAGGRSVFFAAGLRLGHLFRDLLESEATFVSMVSDMVRLCRTEKNRRRLPPASSVREMQLAGGHIRPEHLEMARELFPRARLHKGYGLTEAIRVSMIHSDEPGFSENGAGKALPGQEVQIRDESGRPLAPGERGEIHVRGPNVMLSYGDDDDSPLDPDGFLATGDLGTLDSVGRLTVTGRRDRIFKSYGHRIAAPEIEAVVLPLEDVASACCIPVPCPVRGQRPVLFLELTEVGIARFTNGGRGNIESALIHHLEPYKVPKDIVLLETLPNLSMGKTDLAALGQIWQKAPRPEDLGQGPAGCRFRRFEAAAVGSQLRGSR